jgi:hypothetical protein
MFALSSTLDLLEEVLLRMHQAMNRTALVAPVLMPGVVRMERIHGYIVLARQVLSELWEERQQNAWQDHSHTDE